MKTVVNAGTPTMTSARLPTGTAGPGIARRAALILCLFALVIGQLAPAVHELHIDEADEEHSGHLCAMCAASAKHDEHHESGSQVLPDPPVFVGLVQRPFDSQPANCNLPLDLTARSPPSV